MQLTSAFLGSKVSLKPAPVVQVSKDAPRQVTCMAKKKGVRCIVTLECTEARGEGATPSRYTTQKVQAQSCWLLPSFHVCCAEIFTAAESQEHHRSHGAEEVQQIPQTGHNAQGDQIDVDPGSTARFLCNLSLATKHRRWLSA